MNLFLINYDVRKFVKNKDVDYLPFQIVISEPALNVFALMNSNVQIILPNTLTK